MNCAIASGSRVNNDAGKNFDDDSSSSIMSSSSSSYDGSMNLDDDGDEYSNGNGTFSRSQRVQNNANEIKYAYWIQRTIRDAIYGRVLFAVILKRRPRSLVLIDGAEWEVTTDHCAVKEMSWQHIRREQDHLAEDPIKEVSSMQYLNRWWRQLRGSNNQQQYQQLHNQQQLQHDNHADITESFFAMRNTNIMMPLDLLSDEHNLYSIMPYCDGGELFERLDLNERFSENEARYWMDQVLNGLHNLQKVGICHRDMSLENLLVHKDGALIIDMGMCLLVPYREEDPMSLAVSFDNMKMNGGRVSEQQQQLQQRAGFRRRTLIKPQGICGKWIYMSPEIYRNEEPFDGFAVDMWAAGVILFLMLTGFPPWERACQTDERFHYMSGGYLVQMLTEWDVGLSSDAMDLLQRMLFLDPKDRLSLEQVRAHPWMVNGHREHPSGLHRDS
eukprot:CAMPEP_0197181404 /NCGR_PEP_ID=MMETSP1423-20130617/5705_1 /TAXON_ID=476441 /ORGANISM="Pseudo-nitzschia heimii, Strain UNC1101" /LENGTH=442 /DNA_ID=CAMNT_0042631647 /DNA_START=624 /DNA_END=1952 /DNA_ORIENTATION=-